MRHSFLITIERAEIHLAFAPKGEARQSDECFPAFIDTSLLYSLDLYYTSAKLFKSEPLDRNNSSPSPNISP